VAAALAARAVGRPVRLELTRRQLYSSIGFRPQTRQRVALAADRDGRLRAVIHEATAQTARYEEYAETTLSPTTKAYTCPDLRVRYRLADMDINVPCPMRAPGTVTGIFALETAMDELAVALDMDPLELRLRNFADHDQHRQRPWSSNGLADCYRAGAARFGWHRRSPQPGDVRRNGVRVGCGMAMALYPAMRDAASATVSVFANGTALIRSAASDMGPGTYTSMTQVAADCLGLPVDKVGFELGDTDLPFAPVHGGSITMASLGNAVMAACRAVEHKLVGLAQTPAGGPFAGAPIADLVCRQGAVMRASGAAAGVSYADLLRRHQLARLDGEGRAEPGEEEEKFSSSAFGAVFAEVHVDADLGTIRVPRLVGAYDIGRVINPKVARSQCIGGMVGGIGMALFEAAAWDERFGRVMNGNLAEYLVPVCADIGEIEAMFVPGDDRNFNPLGVKGVAEIAICGVAPAIGNAIYNATGRRLRDLPFTLSSLISP
jgi:xanthine dehydrogenase YagR molybdenum-binding subunit